MAFQFPGDTWQQRLVYAAESKGFDQARAQSLVSRVESGELSLEKVYTRTLGLSYQEGGGDVGAYSNPWRPPNELSLTADKNARIGAPDERIESALVIAQSERTGSGAMSTASGPVIVTYSQPNSGGVPWVNYSPASHEPAFSGAYSLPGGGYGIAKYTVKEIPVIGEGSTARVISAATPPINQFFSRQITPSMPPGVFEASLFLGGIGFGAVSFGTGLVDSIRTGSILSLDTWLSMPGTMIAQGRSLVSGLFYHGDVFEAGAAAGSLGTGILFGEKVVRPIVSPVTTPVTEFAGNAFKGVYRVADVLKLKVLSETRPDLGIREIGVADVASTYRGAFFKPVPVDQVISVTGFTLSGEKVISSMKAPESGIKVEFTGAKVEPSGSFPEGRSLEYDTIKGIGREVTTATVYADGKAVYSIETDYLGRGYLNIGFGNAGEFNVRGVVSPELATFLSTTEGRYAYVKMGTGAFVQSQFEPAIKLSQVDLIMRSDLTQAEKAAYMRAVMKENPNPEFRASDVYRFPGFRVSTNYLLSNGADEALTLVDVSIKRYENKAGVNKVSVKPLKGGGELSYVTSEGEVKSVFAPKNFEVVNSVKSEIVFPEGPAYITKLGLYRLAGREAPVSLAGRVAGIKFGVESYLRSKGLLSNPVEEITPSSVSTARGPGGTFGYVSESASASKNLAFSSNAEDLIGMFESQEAQRTAFTPAVSFNSRNAVVSANVNQVVNRQSTVNQVINREFSASRVASVSVLTNVNRLSTQSTSVNVVRQASASRVASSSVQASRQTTLEKTTNANVNVNVVINRIIGPSTPPAFFPPAGGSKKKEKKLSLPRSQAPFKYTASLLGAFSGKTVSKLPRALTGLEIRFPVR